MQKQVLETDYESTDVEEPDEFASSDSFSEAPTHTNDEVRYHPKSGRILTPPKNRNTNPEPTTNELLLKQVPQGPLFKRKSDPKPK